MKVFFYGLIISTTLFQYGHTQHFQRHQDPGFVFPTPPAQTPRTISDLIDTINKFAWDAFHASKLPNVSSNLILSPVMIQLMLSALEKAAAGETKVQIEQVIGKFDSEELIRLLRSGGKSSQSQIELASGMFVDSLQHLNQSFVDQARQTNVDVRPVQFKQGERTKSLINQWAANATRGLIPKLLSDSYDVQDLQLILASAIYFHDTWKYRFNSIAPIYFDTENGARAVQFMELQQELVWEEIVVNHAVTGSLIEIPYENDAFSMVILMPDRQYTLDTFIRSMTSDHFLGVSRTIFTKKPKYVTLRMPKFEANSRFSVVNALLKLGLVDLFTTNSKLPYIGLSEDPKISDIIQQAVLKVDENGTTAAAATASFLIPLSADYADHSTMIVDRPFIAIIFDRISRVPIFISKIYQP